MSARHTDGYTTRWGRLLPYADRPETSCFVSRVIPGSGNMCAPRKLVLAGALTEPVWRSDVR